MKQIIVSNIQWDAPRSVKRELPKKIIIDITSENEHFLEDIDEGAEYVSDYISDLTGWCHYGFAADVREVK